MVRSQVVSKKGRNSSSSEGPGHSPQAARRARRSSSGRRSTGARRPTAKGKVGSKGKGSNAARRATGNASARRRPGTPSADERSVTARDTGLKPEASQPPTLVAGDATVAEQRRAASRQDRGARTDRPPAAQPRKAGARGGGPVDRDATEAGRRRTARGDGLEVGRQDLAEPTRESERGAVPRGGEEGRIARARRATPTRAGLGFKDDE